jgi:hypothetical protein
MLINKRLIRTINIKFFGLDNTLTWKSHIERITPKLSAACYAIRAIRPSASQDVLEIM